MLGHHYGYGILDAAAVKFRDCGTVKFGFHHFVDVWKQYQLFLVEVLVEIGKRLPEQHLHIV